MLTFNCIYINPNIDKKFFMHCIEKTMRSNSLFRCDNKLSKFFYKSNFSKNEEEFMFSSSLLNTNTTDFYDKILIVIKKSHEKAILVKTSYPNELSDCSIQHDGGLESLVWSVIYKIDADKIGILDFISCIILKLATKQIWRNANKRTAIISAAKLFEIFGLYITFSSDDENYLRQWHEFIVSIAKRYEDIKQQNDINDTENKILEDIKNKCWSSFASATSNRFLVPRRNINIYSW
jgi:prophage maintenance system killer protein